MNIGKILIATLGTLMASLTPQEIKYQAAKIGKARRTHSIGPVGVSGTGGPSRKCRRLRAKMGIV